VIDADSRGDVKLVLANQELQELAELDDTPRGKQGLSSEHFYESIS